jgi:uncharacterized HAD superfamily protein/hypoxanthine phosphoribosyltransferase
VRANLHKIPHDIDLVVGIPRSGMIPAYMIGLYTNRAVVDLTGFLDNRTPGKGHTRTIGVDVAAPQAARHILLVDDSIASGQSLQRVLATIASTGFAGRVTTCAAITLPSNACSVDVSFREVPHPRIFEWNAFHHSFVEKSCFDLDGILCVDPCNEENDDGPRYLQFLGGATPLIRPTRRIGHIVSARLEKYREPTEQWLKAHGIEYGKLHLIDLPSGAERRRLGAHCTHKASVYRDTGAVLFYESEAGQARQIAKLSGKPVLCTYDMTLQMPSGVQLGAPLKHARWRLQRPLGRLKGWLRQQLNGAPAAVSRR